MLKNPRLDGIGYNKLFQICQPKPASIEIAEPSFATHGIVKRTVGVLINNFFGLMLLVINLMILKIIIRTIFKKFFIQIQLVPYFWLKSQSLITFLLGTRLILYPQQMIFIHQNLHVVRPEDMPGVYITQMAEIRIKRHQ